MDTAIRTDAQSFPLPATDLEQAGFRKDQINRLIELIEKHIAEGRYPGSGAASVGTVTGVSVAVAAISRTDSAGRIPRSISSATRSRRSDRAAIASAKGRSPPACSRRRGGI